MAYCKLHYRKKNDLINRGNFYSSSNLIAYKTVSINLFSVHRSKIQHRYRIVPNFLENVVVLETSNTLKYCYMHTIFSLSILDYNMFKYFRFLYIEIHKYTWHSLMALMPITWRVQVDSAVSRFVC